MNQVDVPYSWQEAINTNSSRRGIGTKKFHARVVDEGNRLDEETVTVQTIYGFKDYLGEELGYLKWRNYSGFHPGQSLLNHLK